MKRQCISTGVYGYPIEDAAKVAVGEVKEFLSPAEDAENAEEMEVIFCCFSERDMAIYQELIGHLDAERAYGAQG